jgi:hypothetical protein
MLGLDDGDIMNKPLAFDGTKPTVGSLRGARTKADNDA